MKGKSGENGPLLSKYKNQKLFEYGSHFFEAK
jgi:hypothetical protein